MNTHVPVIYIKNLKTSFSATVMNTYVMCILYVQSGHNCWIITVIQNIELTIKEL